MNQEDYGSTNIPFARFLNFGTSYERVLTRKYSAGISILTFTGIQLKYSEVTGTFPCTGIEFFVKEYSPGYIAPLGWFYQAGIGLFSANPMEMVHKSMPLIGIGLGQDNIKLDKLVLDLGINLRITGWNSLWGEEVFDGETVSSSGLMDNFRFTVTLGIGYLSY